MTIDGERLITLPSHGILEAWRERKKDKKCCYCKKIVKDNPWWNIWSFRPYCEIGKDTKTGEWIYVCEKCTRRWAKDFSKQIYEWGKEYRDKEKRKNKHS